MTTINNFASRILQGFESEIGFSKKEIDNFNLKPQSPAASLYASCKKWSKEHNFSLLSDVDLSNIMFTTNLIFRLKHLKKDGKASINLLRILRNDKPNFLNRAYEIEIASYFNNKPGHDAFFITDKASPDLEITYNGKKEFLECKKINSESNNVKKYINSIEQNLADAIKKINNCGNGAILVEIDNRFGDIFGPLEELIKNIWENNAMDKISSITFTWWEKRPQDFDKHGSYCAIRRFGKNYPNPAIQPPVIFDYSGETIEFVHHHSRFYDIIVSQVARSDDFINTQKHMFISPDFISLGPVESFDDYLNSQNLK